MNIHTPRMIVPALAAVAVLALAGCSSDSETSSAPASSTTTSTTTTTTAAKSTSTTTKRKPTPTKGTNPTIADYIQRNGITETPIKMGDPDAPAIDLPVPTGWQIAGADTPEWAYGAIVYSGGGDYQPSIIALLSRLDGDVDAQQVIDLAGGEVNNLDGFEPVAPGRVDTFAGFPAYSISGSHVDGGQEKLVGQKTVVIPGRDGLYVLQLNLDALPEQVDIVNAATPVINEQTTITP